MDPARADDPRSIDLASLGALLGDFEPRDEDLVLEPAPRIGNERGTPRIARYAGVDGERRAILVLSSEGDEAVLLAIDALAWCDAHGDLLARRIGADVELGPCVVLILERPTDALLAALGALRSGDLRVFVARHLRSARSGGGDLVEVQRAASSRAAEPISAWDADLDTGARQLVERVVRALPRIDPDGRASPGPRSIVWRRGRAALVQLRSAGGGLEADADGERFAVTCERDVERVIAAALRAYLALDTEAEPASPREVGTPPTALLPTGPLLSDDELAALRGED